ncbi:restriction endonuclease subunit S [Mameliella alba]|nr:restriction endonuclease subunit S [Mameliella alba]
MTASQKYGIILQSDFEKLEGVKVMQVTKNAEILKHVEPGDFVISMRSFQGGLELSHDRGCVSSAYVALEPRDGVRADFYRYLFKSVGYIQALQATTNLVRDGQALRYANFVQVSVPFPPLPEQHAIAGFLDRETAKIDALVEEQRRLIALLKEKRQAVISHAVTKGLDPAAPMKPSGIDWLGDIPAHWEAVQAKRFVSIINGFAFPSTGFETDENAVRLLRGINVGVGEVRWEPENTVRWTRKADDKLDAWELQAGDLVLGMDRPWISSGVRVAVMQEDDVPSLLLQRVAALRTHQGLVPPFLYRQLQSEAFVHHFLPETTGVSVPHISPSQIGSFVITVPPEEEQQEIVEHIDEQIRQFGELEAEAERAITLLQERRSALISAAVTGKIDLRDTTSNSTEAA